MHMCTKVNNVSISRMKDHALLALLLTSEATRYFSLEKAAAVLEECDGSIYKLSNLKTQEIASLSYLGYADAIKLKAMQEFSNRNKIQEVLEKPKISCSDDGYQLFKHLSEQPYEEFWIMILNRANKLIDQIKISEGGISGTVVDQRKIFKFVIDAYGSGILLAHNHPSGNIQPSDADINVTEKIIAAGALFDIAVMDHLIIVQGGYYSFADNGMI